MAQAPVIEIKDLSTCVGGQLLHQHLNLTVAPGEIVGLVGGSGSGKSVLLRVMTGLLQPESGQVMILGRPVGSWQERERATAFGVLFQQGALFSGLSVLANVMLPLKEFGGKTRAECEKIAKEKLRAVGLPENAYGKFPSELSGGMIKRAGLARAMALDPKILFLDEPTSGLDPIAADEFDDLIRDVNRETGMTILMITHDLESLVDICTRIAVLVDRQLVAGPLKELTASKNEWVHQYFNGQRGRAAINLPRGRHGA